MSFINQGVRDIRSTLQCSGHSYTVQQLEAALKDEQKARNRTTVVNMLQSAIKKKGRSTLIIEQV